MVVNINENAKKITYKDIRQGELFAYIGEIYIKTEVEYKAGDYMSILLEDGSKMYFGEDCEVNRVDGELNATIIGG